MTVTTGAYYPERPGDGMTMDDVTQTPAQHRKPRTEGLVAAWLCLIIAGGTTATFNIWNAVFSSMALLPGILEGVAPVALAMVVSHLVATSRAGKFLKSVTFAVMVGAMVLSVHATGVVVRPAAGPLWWLFGAVIDTAALVALQVLLSIKARAVREAGERVATETAAADERTALRAELDALKTGKAGELQSLMSDLEAARNAHADAEQRAAEALTRAETAEQKLAAKSAQAKRAKSAQDSKKNARDEDLTLEFRALDELQKDPSLRAPRMGGELARRIGASPATGRRLHSKLTAQHPSPESLTERSADPSDERS